MIIHDTSAGGQPPAEDRHDVRAAAAPAKRRLHRLLPACGLPAIGYFAGVIALLGVAQILPPPAYLLVDAVAFLAAGSWCGVNFWRCRQAHCLATGSGWLLLAMFAVAEAGFGRSLIGGDEQLVFLGTLAIGLIFECVWNLMHRTSAVTRASRRTPDEPPARRAVVS